MNGCKENPEMPVCAALKYKESHNNVMSRWGVMKHALSNSFSARLADIPGSGQMSLYHNGILCMCLYTWNIFIHLRGQEGGEHR